MEVEITSKECIKPSSSTPSNLKTRNLSLLDYDALPPAMGTTNFSKPFLYPSKRIARRFVFDASAITSLTAKTSSSSLRHLLSFTSHPCGTKKEHGQQQNPTRVEVVTALLDKCMRAASKAASGMQRPAIITHAVNLRQRAVTPLRETFMGNIVWSVGALCMQGDQETDLPFVITNLREAITKIDDDFYKSWDGSWCNFGLYDIDFGWGKPVWIGNVGLSEGTESWIPNLIVLMDTKTSGGIEAWVWLDKENMVIPVP
ncbi:vinorine synthase-like [Carya illinoinensis]|uniref:vinorine synthase-like n=1 Tax=Carya illinoinensis TaxID=32201 RepID=UPI001C7292AF|nr:vinorine synthase-like [Carya illinoinensis]